MVIFSLMGWFLKRAAWPRPPLVLGLVLGEIIESRLYLSLQLHGPAFLLRPIVVVIFVLIVATVAYGAFQEWRSKQVVKVPLVDEN
jgi:TctA family transporter